MNGPSNRSAKLGILRHLPEMIQASGLLDPSVPDNSDIATACGPGNSVNPWAEGSRLLRWSGKPRQVRLPRETSRSTHAPTPFHATPASFAGRSVQIFGASHKIVWRIALEEVYRGSSDRALCRYVATGTASETPLIHSNKIKITKRDWLFVLSRMRLIPDATGRRPIARQ